MQRLNISAANDDKDKAVPAGKEIAQS